MNFENDKLWNADGTTGEFTGIQGGSGTTKSFFAGASNKEGDDAKAFITANGKIFYAALGKSIFNRTSTAGFSPGNTASSITAGTWKTAAESDAADLTVTETKIYASFTKRFGENVLMMSGQLRLQAVIGSPGSGSRARVRMKTGGLSETYELASFGTTTDFDFQLDISSIADNERLVLEVELEAFLNQNNSGTTQRVEATLREDLNIFTATA